MKILTALMLSFLFSSSVWASFQVTSFRTLNGQKLSLGDNLKDMASRIGQSPSSVKSQLWFDGKKNIQAMLYTYEIDNAIYYITIANNVVKRIEFERKAQ